MTAVETLLVSIDRTYLGALYRVVIGFFLIPVLSRLGLDVSSVWTLAVGLLVVLLSLRIFPVIVRKLVPFSSAANAVWNERRQIAKIYDSYQWQKLFFVGIGLAGYTLVSREFLNSRIFISVFCVACGAIGLARWSAVVNKVRSGLVHKGAI